MDSELPAYLCPSCAGTGASPYLFITNRDGDPRPVDCGACNGTGRASPVDPSAPPVCASCQDPLPLGAPRAVSLSRGTWCAPCYDSASTRDRETHTAPT